MSARDNGPWGQPRDPRLGGMGADVSPWSLEGRGRRDSNMAKDKQDRRESLRRQVHGLGQEAALGQSLFSGLLLAMILIIIPMIFLSIEESKDKLKESSFNT